MLLFPALALEEYGQDYAGYDQHDAYYHDDRAEYGYRVALHHAERAAVYGHRTPLTSIVGPNMPPKELLKSLSMLLEMKVASAPMMVNGRPLMAM